MIHYKIILHFPLTRRSALPAPRLWRGTVLACRESPALPGVVVDIEKLVHMHHTSPEHPLKSLEVEWIRLLIVNTGDNDFYHLNLPKKRNQKCAGET